MIVWVMYDIVGDRSRNKVAKACKQAGLYRVQFSVFLGKMTADDKDSLSLYIEGLINEKEDSVYIFPMSKDELQQTDLLGLAFDKKFVTDEVHALFF